jgi:hypothetical protein
MFGIGFWTILRFNPRSILIESFYRGNKWAILVDSELKPQQTACSLEKNGTRITMIRPQKEQTLNDYTSLIENALVRYCSYLRRNTRKFSSLPVYFSGKRITFPMRLKSQISMNFKKGPVEGVVGFSSKPKVYLYAKGLPVWVGTYMDELSHIPTAKSKYKDIPQGLAPVYLINGNNLNVNISRKRIIDDNALKNTRKTAEEALDHLIETIALKVSPGHSLERIFDKIKRIPTYIKTSLWKSLVIILLVVLPLEFIVIKTFFKGKQEIQTPSIVSIKTDNNQYAGASVTRARSQQPIDLSYSPPKDMLFKLYNVDNYDVISGFTKTLNPGDLKRFKNPTLEENCRQESCSIAININERGTLYLPRPLFCTLVPNSITLNNQSLSPALYQSSDDVVMVLNQEGVIRYKCCPLKEDVTPAQKYLNSLTFIPEKFSFPSSLQQPWDQVAALPVEEKAQLALRLTFSLLKYDTSASTAIKYEASSAQEWFQKVIQVGAGDCDILSGVNVLFLRKMGVPSRLAIGLIGKNGRVIQGMHAWAEYYNNGWHIIDATLYSPIEESATQEHGQRNVPFVDSTEAFPEPHESRKNLGSTSSRGENFFIKLPDRKLLFLVLIFAGSSLVIFLTVRKRMYSDIVHGKDIKKMKEELAGMAIHALLHPDVWGENSHILSFKILPTLQGKSISLNQAIKLVKSKRLFYLNSSNPMAKGIKNSVLPIVESGHSAFDPLIKLLPGAINLDYIISLKATKPNLLEDQKLGALLQAVNKFIFPRCLSAPGLKSEDCLDVDLSKLPSSLLKKLGFPRQFMAVNPESRRIKSLLSLYETNERLAQYKLIKFLLEKSTLIPGPHPELLKQVATTLLKEDS